MTNFRIAICSFTGAFEHYMHAWLKMMENFRLNQIKSLQMVSNAIKSNSTENLKDNLLLALIWFFFVFFYQLQFDPALKMSLNVILFYLH